MSESSVSPPGGPGTSPGHTPTTEVRTCASCEGEGYTPISHDYNPATGLLTIVGGLCVACGGEGEITVYLYGVGR